jgi:uncharacterized protein involved in exopolysaccharide biosynthesis
MSESRTLSDQMASLEQLKKRQRDLENRVLILKSKKDQETVKLSNIEKEMISLGTSKETIEIDLKRAQEEFTQELDKYNLEITELERTVSQAEKSLESLTSRT